MSDINRIILKGRLGGDPIYRETKTGAPVVQLSVATSRKLAPKEQIETSPGNEVEVSGTENSSEATQWHRVVVWGRDATLCRQFLKKGDTVYVEGSVRIYKYTAKDNGGSRLAFEVHATQIGQIGRARSMRSFGQTQNETVGTGNVTGETPSYEPSETTSGVMPDVAQEIAMTG